MGESPKCLSRDLNLVVCSCITVSIASWYIKGLFPGALLAQTSQLSLFHSETQGFWSILKVIPSNLTVKRVSLTQNVEPNHP